MSISILDTIQKRYSCRAFLDKPVTHEQIHAMLDAARFAPSGVNTQPWKVAAISNPNILKQLGDAIVANREAQTPENPDYHYYPDTWFDPYKGRRVACGKKLYGALGIERGDDAARKAQWYRNYYFFGAPVGLLLFIDKRLEKGSWMDVGMFLQNIMIAARGLGLETCPLASLAEYPDIVRQTAGVSSEYSVICGIAVGYADETHKINQYRTDREEVDAFTTWVE